MPIVATIVALAAVVWGTIYARRGSLIVGCAIFLIVGYVFGHEFWHAKLGPLPLTLDRVVLAGLVAAFAIQWRLGLVRTMRPVGGDWLLAARLALLAASALLSGQPETADYEGSKWGRLAFSFLLPALLYWIARQSNATRREWQVLLASFVALGVYLAVTAVCEIAGVWSLVFPRYIANPDLGIHFGRARGPGLNAASLGIFLTACVWCGWLLWPEVRRRWQQLLILIALSLMALGVLLTYTRSTWLGLAASGLVVCAIQIPRRWRVPAITTAMVAGLLVAAVAWSHIVGLEREGSAAESHHSVDQRKSFAYVSWQMLKDHPMFGVGFGRFYDRKLPYLSDRRQEVELESIRSLHHHNTLLSLLTETGMVGLAAFVALMVAWARYAWRLANAADMPSWVRGQGVLFLALMVNYLCSAVFHDLTPVPPQQWLLFLCAGVTASVWQQVAARHAVGSAEFHETHHNRSDDERGREPFATGTLSQLDGFPVAKDSRPLPTVPLFGMRIARVTMRETVDQVLAWCTEPRAAACRYIVTPNVDHAVMFQRRCDVRAAYADASLVLADGAPIVFVANLLNKRLPERVAGSDLVPQLFDSASQPLRVFLLGAAPGVADRSAARIAERWRAIEVVGTCSPPLGFENDAAESARILAAVAAAQPDLLIVGLGAPKQELWVHRHHRELQAKVALCAGATIDFLAGQRQRSPVWMRRAGLEWLHRVLTEPRRLAGRYARDAWIFPQLVWREWRGHYS